MDRSTFSLVGYHFDRVVIDFQNQTDDKHWIVSIHPKGVYNESSGEYKLQFIFEGRLGESENSPYIMTQCNALFKFSVPLKLDEIPSYFYPNSIAIVFPYVRSFVSTVTLQANLIPVILPTYNLSSLKEELIHQTSLS